MYYRNMKKTPSVSIIIPSHRPEMVGSLLDSLLVQIGDTLCGEIIVIADYPAGDLQLRYPDCIWLAIPDRSISRKRNAGAAIASADLIAFIDDDCIASPDWLEQGTAYMANHPHTAAVIGSTTVVSSPDIPRSATREYRRLETPGYRANNLFFRSEKLRAAGGFDERFTVQYEDSDLAFTCLEQGMSIDFCEDIKVIHRFREEEKWDLLKNCWNRRFYPLLLKKHPAGHLKQIGSPVPPSIAAVMLTHCAAFVFAGKKRLRLWGLPIEAVVLLLLGLRRSGFHPERLLREAVQLAIAPFVLFAALVYGWFIIAKRPQGPSSLKSHTG